MNRRSLGTAWWRTGGRKITGKGPSVNVMRFDGEVGEFAPDVREESGQLLRGMGAICLQIGPEVKVPTATKASRVLALLTDWYGIGNLPADARRTGHGSALVLRPKGEASARPPIFFHLGPASHHQ